MQNNYMLEKQLWTEVDFDLMSWHDCYIHGFTFNDNFELLLDIDYIFKWVNKGKRFNFWIAPCTLIFENVYDVNLEMESTTSVIDNIDRYDPQRPKNAEYINRETEYEWCIELLAGEITFKAVGYKQYVRRLPQLKKEQKLNVEERGGVSFDIQLLS